MLQIDFPSMLFKKMGSKNKRTVKLIALPKDNYTDRFYIDDTQCSVIRFPYGIERSNRYMCIKTFSTKKRVLDITWKYVGRDIKNPIIFEYIKYCEAVLDHF